MLQTYFTRKRTRTTYYVGPARPYLDDFPHWLEEHGFATRTIRRCLCGAVQFAGWAEAAGSMIQDSTAALLDASHRSLNKYGSDDIPQAPPFAA